MILPVYGSGVLILVASVGILIASAVGAPGENRVLTPRFCSHLPVSVSISVTPHVYSREVRWRRPPSEPTTRTNLSGSCVSTYTGQSPAG